MSFTLTRRQWAFLRELTKGPSRWYADDPDARALTRRGLAVYDRGAYWHHFVITEKGKAALLTRFGPNATAETIAFDAETYRLEEFAQRTLNASIPCTPLSDAQSSKLVCGLIQPPEPMKNGAPSTRRLSFVPALQLR
jgi:hypothetical protein